MTFSCSPALQQKMTVQPDQKPNSIITLTGILICMVIVGITLFLALKPSVQKPDPNIQICLSNLGNMGKAMALYRADNDGYSPVITSPRNKSMLNALSKYLGSQSMICPAGGPAIQFRVAAIPGTREFVFYGTYDKSVIAYCDSHLKTKSSTAWNWFKTKQVQVFDPKDSGITNILMKDGSVKSIPASSPFHEWILDKGVFKIHADSMKPIPSTGQRLFIYTFEPTPPRLER